MGPSGIWALPNYSAAAGVKTTSYINKTTVMSVKPAEHMKAISEHDATALLNVCEADGTLKRLHVLNNTVVLGGYQRVVVHAFTLPHRSQHRHGWLSKA